MHARQPAGIQASHSLLITTLIGGRRPLTRALARGHNRAPPEVAAAGAQSKACRVEPASAPCSGRPPPVLRAVVKAARRVPVRQRPAPPSCSSASCTTLLFVRLLCWVELRRWYSKCDVVNRDRVQLLDSNEHEPYGCHNAGQTLEV